MRVHHLNCISTCPLGGKLMDRRTDSIPELFSSHIVFRPEL